MMNFIKTNKVLLGGIAVICGAVFLYYSYAGSAAPLLTSATETSPVSQELLVTLGSLRTIQLDPSLFSDPVFLSLSDFGVTIPPQQAGRRNPFAPVGAN